MKGNDYTLRSFLAFFWATTSKLNLRSDSFRVSFAVPLKLWDQQGEELHERDKAVEEAIVKSLFQFRAEIRAQCSVIFLSAFVCFVP